MKDECGGHYGRFLQYVIKSRADFDAYTLQEAMDGIGCNETIVAELYLTRSASELEAMRTTWEARYNASLLDRLKDELGGDFEKFILKLFKGKNDGQDADPELATAQANELYEAGPGRTFGTDGTLLVHCHNAMHRLLIWDFCQRSLFSKFFPSRVAHRLS